VSELQIRILSLVRLSAILLGVVLTVSGLAQAQQRTFGQGLRPVAVSTGSTAGTSAGAAPAALPSDSTRRGVPLSQASWTFEAAPPPKQFKLNDQLTVLVSEKSVVTSEGQMDRRKKADGHLTLSDWISLNNWSIRRAPQSSGDPKVAGEVENKYRAQADLETRDSMTFKIAVRVVDIRPNGTMVVEGTKNVRNNNEFWEASLAGVVRPEDVLPNNSVLSENVAELRIVKREAGHVRDGYRRGWLLEFLDRYQPF
jgi:flagellar L-ring protein precursor FlgH